MTNEENPKKLATLFELRDSVSTKKVNAQEGKEWPGVEKQREYLSCKKVHHPWHEDHEREWLDP